jgi:hypothetical protein
MALANVTAVLVQMREKTARLSAIAKAEMEREAQERAISTIRPRAVTIRLGGARCGMKKPRRKAR